MLVVEFDRSGFLGWYRNPDRAAREPLADALPKLRGLVEFARKFASDFRRIESVAETNGVLRVLDLTKPNTREAILIAESARGLYESSLADDY